MKQSKRQSFAPRNFLSQQETGEFMKMIAAQECPDLYDVAVLMLRWGLSLQELEQLQWSAIDFEGGTATVHRAELILSTAARELLLRRLRRSDATDNSVFGDSLPRISERILGITMLSPLGMIDLVTLERSFINIALRDGRNEILLRVLQRIQNDDATTCHADNGDVVTPKD
jgi:integrase